MIGGGGLAGVAVNPEEDYFEVEGEVKLLETGLKYIHESEIVSYAII